MSLIIQRAGPALSLQDLGRPGHIARGIAPGGAADRLALLEAAALLGTPVTAALEMPMMGGVFEVSAPRRIALTGAPMQARLDGALIGWQQSHLLLPGQKLEIGAAQSGVYGYLTPAGGVAEPGWLGSHAVQAGQGIGALLRDGDRLELAPDPAPDTPARVIAAEDRFSGGTLRVMPGLQTEMFDHDTLARLQRSLFRRDAQANRQGVRLTHDGAPFGAAGTANLVSDFITMGDVQMTGDGVPYVLLSDCQTIGGYPRIGTVIAADLPKLAQAPLGAPLRLQLLSLQQADVLWRDEVQQLQTLRANVRNKLRDPHQMRDLLSYEMISGAVRGDEGEQP